MTRASLPFARLVRTRRAWLPLALWILFALGAAVLARRGGAVHGANHALLGAYGTVALPLLVYGVVAAILGGDSLSHSGAALVLFGASPVRVARDTIFATIAVSAGLSAALAMAVAAVAHGQADPPLARDLLSCAEIGALGGAAYAAFFCLGGSFGMRGLGRSIFLVADWLFAGGRGVTSVFFPRAHVRGLLGGASPLGMPGSWSLALLALLALLYTTLALQRAGRAQWALPRVE